MPSRVQKSFDRKLRKLYFVRFLKRALELFSVFAMIHYVSLLMQFHSNTNTEDPAMAALQFNQKGEKENITTARKVNSTGQNHYDIQNNVHYNDQLIESKQFTGNDHGKTKKDLPLAKWLLKSQPPFQDSDIKTLYSNGSKTKILIKSPNTVVTGYFRVRSKHHSDKYDDWMRNMLSLQDAMVIFTEPSLVDQIKELRGHAVNRTVIVPISLNDLPIGKLFSESFWQDQLERDPEKRIHRSYQLFWIWLSKSWFVTQAIRLNVYESDLFVWSDIGCFRDRTYNSKTLVLHREKVPPREILQMAHHKPNPPDEKLFNDKYKLKNNFYHSGSQFAGYKDTLLTFHKYFLETIDRFLVNNMIIVEDQAVLQSVCLSYPEICAYSVFTHVKDNRYFGLRRILHFGGESDYWRLTSNS